MTRVISGVVIAAGALALIWFLSSIALLGVALVIAAMAFHEYDRIVDRIGAKIPYWTTLLATLVVCSMVPFQWVDLESVLAAALLVIALNVLRRPASARRCSRIRPPRCWRRSTSAFLSAAWSASTRLPAGKACCC